MKAKKEFAGMHQDCITIVRGIKLKNDIINKKHGVESEAKLLSEIHKDKTFFESELSRLKGLMNKMEENYLDPDSVRKLESIRKEAKKQVDRNEQLIRQLVNSSFVQMQTHEDEGREYENARGGQSQSLPKKVTSFNPYDNNLSETNGHDPRINQTQILVNDDLTTNYQLQDRLNQQKNKVMNEVAKDFIILNGIINQTAMMIDEQGENLDIITEDMVRTHKNIEMGNSHLIEAGEYQKRATKKYIFFALLIILICLLVGVPVIMLT